MNHRAPRFSYRLELGITAALALATWLTFANLVDARFTNYDDHLYVTQNEHVRQGLSLSSLRWALATTDCSNWHPLTWLSLEADYQIFGLNPAGYHATNVALHILNSVLLFWALRLMSGFVWRSATVAAFFALHPLHVESVAWIAERKDVLCATFAMLVLLAYRQYILRPHWTTYGWVVLSFALGLMAKPMLVTFPFVLLLLDYWPLRRPRWAEEAPVLERRENAPPCLGSEAPLRLLLIEKSPLLLLSAACCIVTIVAQRSGGALRSIESIPFGFRVTNALVSYVVYLRQTFWPADLSVLYPYPREGLPLWQTCLVAAFLLTVSVAVARFGRRRRYLRVGWLWYLGMLVPVIGLVQVGEQARADRYLYLPMIGLLVGLVWGVGDLAAARRWSGRVVGAATIGLLVACAVLSRQQTTYWHDSISLWRHAVEVAAPNPVAYNSLGVALAEKGQYDEAARWLTQSVQLDPDDERARQNLALALLRLDRIDESIEQFRQALRINPRSAPAHFNLGVLLDRRGEQQAAIEHFRLALAADPTYWRAHLQLARALHQLGDEDEAQRHFATAMQLQPNLASAAAQRQRRRLIQPNPPTAED